MKRKYFGNWRTFLALSLVLLVYTCNGQRKPSPQEWVDSDSRPPGRSPEKKLNFISWLVDGCYFYDSTLRLPNGIQRCNVTFRGSVPPENSAHPPEFQSFDGFYNNVFKTDLGAVDTPLLRRVPPVYNDGVYEPVKRKRINPFEASELMNRSPVCKRGNVIVACGSKTGKSAFLVYFGQQVVEEILDAQRPGCPPEYFNVKIPKDHEFFKHHSEMPLLRSRYSQSTGHSPGNPRQQLNEITPWIDGGLIYGTSKGWADVLRTNPNTGELAEHGKLATDESGLFPARNKLRMPLANPPPPAWHRNWTQRHETANVDRFFVLGNPRGNENAFLLAFGVVLFRWHNQFATYLHDSRPTWSGERIFQESRKWTIGTYQHIVMYDWLPEWLGEPLESYKGYDPSADPQIEQFFQTAAMRFGHTLVTPGAYMRDYSCAGCSPISFHGLGGAHRQNTFDSTHTVRTCNIFWRPQEPLEMQHPNLNETCGEIDDSRTTADIDRLLMGMASQRAEREDHMIVQDLRGRVFGPLEFPRRDLMAVNIQRGRDHGTPDYNTAREAFGLPRIKSVQDYMTLTGTHTPKDIIDNLYSYHNCDKTTNPANNCSLSESAWDNIDVWTGGILETSERPGPLFRAIIKDQFLRIRNADRFWFENTKWKKPRFSGDQINRIKTLKVYDMIISVSRMLPEDLQQNPFQIPTNTNTFPGRSNANCSRSTTPTARGGRALNNNKWETSQCYSQQYSESGSRVGLNRTFPCYHFPQLDSAETPVEECTPPGSYDYFKGSEASFIATFIIIGTFTIGTFGVLYFVSKMIKMKKTEKLNSLRQQMVTKFQNMGLNEIHLAAREWQSFKRGTRAVALVINRGKLEVRCHRGEILRDIDFNKVATADSDGNTYINVITFPEPNLIIENPKEYDLVLEFESNIFRDSFLAMFQNRLENLNIITQVQDGVLKQRLKTVITKCMRMKMLEKFFRDVFKIGSEGNREDVYSEISDQQTLDMELTLAEFSDALGMTPTSDFAQKMFRITDKDENGYVSFQEFFCMLVIFKNGTAKDKAQLLFQMYDVSKSGKVSLTEFKAMMKSMISAARADVDDSLIDESIDSMISTANVGRTGVITINEFQRLVQDHNGTIESAQLTFRGLNIPSTPATSNNRKSYNERVVHSFTEMNSRNARLENNQDSSDMGSMTISKENAKASKFCQWESWFELNRLKIFCVTLYTLVVAAIFAERAYYYSVEREHSGLRHIAGYGVTVTRGAASVMMFCYATLLLTMCRNLITKLRETFLQRWIPFDGFIAMHKYIACIGLLFTVIHVIGHGFNFYHISTQTADDLSCLFRDYHRPTHVLPKFHYWTFQTVTGLTGVFLVIHAAIIYTFATKYARHHTFRIFWTTHQSYFIFYILLILHGSGRLIQDPLFFNFLVGPLVLFVIDKIITTGRESIEIPVMEAQLLPSNVTKLKICRPTGFEFKSGQWIRIASLALNPNEFHPFTISSAPHEPHLTVHIRAVGPFTVNIRQAYESSMPKLYLDGPYGEGHQEWYRYEVAVLIGGGIGVTPFASILKDVAANPNLRNCKKIYFLWVTKTQKQFEWMVDIIRDVENHTAITAHVFITQLYDQFDLRTVLLYICERNFQKVSNRSLFTGLKSVTHFGRPDFRQFFSYLQTKHPDVTRFGVFSCGPLPMSKSVDDACIDINNEQSYRSVVFNHHHENF